MMLNGFMLTVNCFGCPKHVLEHFEHLNYSKSPTYEHSFHTYENTFKINKHTNITLYLFAAFKIK